ncbi:hypothetical protein GOP47_0020661 [Adiantum capillus-veneris]|uniref:NADH kinase n=1 Tax=Adiantum capillus-veneris TaxID=13818 RepID=A0A9D4UBG8_ADICA|nr:hypothetical protein GOP47_0020661 [Adiantum capillus-veneris]
MQRVLLFVKRTPFDLHFNKRFPEAASTLLRRVIGHLQKRDTKHEATIKTCKDVLDKRGLSWKSLYWDELNEKIRDVDLVVTIGGDGTLLQASHFLGSSIPIFGVNSDPTQINELEKNSEFDANRSTGYLCVATKDTFEQVLEEVIEEKRCPLSVKRISTRVNDSLLQACALNDVLLAHPDPSAMTKCTLRVCKKHTSEPVSPPIHTRSSGLRICTGIGSTAAMNSAGGYVMAPSSKKLQYMVREPSMPNPLHQRFIHKMIEEDEMLHVEFSGEQGTVYMDGPHLYHNVRYGDVIEFSTDAPELQMFMNDRNFA